MRPDASTAGPASHLAAFGATSRKAAFDAAIEQGIVDMRDRMTAVAAGASLTDGMKLFGGGYDSDLKESIRTAHAAFLADQWEREQIRGASALAVLNQNMPFEALVRAYLRHLCEELGNAPQELEAEQASLMEAVNQLKANGEEPDACMIERLEAIPAAIDDARRKLEEFLQQFLRELVGALEQAARAAIGGGGHM